MMVGAPFWGYLADYYGRKTVSQDSLSDQTQVSTSSIPSQIEYPAKILQDQSINQSLFAPRVAFVLQRSSIVYLLMEQELSTNPSGLYGESCKIFATSW